MRRRVTAVAAATVTVAVAAVGCAHTVSGAAHRAHPGMPVPQRSFGYVENRCGLLTDSSVQQVLGADSVVRPYSGAVCQYVLARGTLLIDVSFSWFHSGSLDRERALAAERGAAITALDLVGYQGVPAGFLARRDVTGAACSATAGAGGGVLSWWVQLRGRARRRSLPRRRTTVDGHAVLGHVTWPR